MREEPTSRHHQTYCQPHWSAVDINGVDRTDVYELDGFDGFLRLDLDGVAADNRISEFDLGENVQSSVWLDEKHARKMYQQFE